MIQYFFGKRKYSPVWCEGSYLAVANFTSAIKYRTYNCDTFKVKMVTNK